MSPESPHDHALRLIEFPRILELVARLATSPLGAEWVRALRPHLEREAATRALAATDDMVTFLLRTPDWAPPPVPDVRAALGRLEIDGSVLDEEALAGIATLLRSSRRARGEIRRRSEAFGYVGELADGLVKRTDVEERLDRSLDSAGEVADGASPALARLRRQMRSERSTLVARLERFAGALPERFGVADASITIRSGRYCVPIRREGRSHVGGLVHDESASSRTLFVEPPLAIEPMNRVRELELSERREVRRILSELTELLRPLVDALRGCLKALTEIDALFARATYALAHGGTRPELGADGDRGIYRIRGGYHPILLAVDERAVPFDLELALPETVVLVSGPNAGGKTVLLKAIGLVSAMAQSGIVPPVGEGTALPTFRSFFAIIGDEQSIDASLSTFSAQIANLREIVERSDRSSLVLIDEIGGNTDPAEGSALAAATLLRLAGQAALSVVTTHLGDLKTLAGEDERVVNASLQFDPGTLRPTYRLVRDRPGRSYALEISERLGLPDDLLAAARGRLSTGTRALDAVLSELEVREEELGRLRARLDLDHRELERVREGLEKALAEAEHRETELADRERALETDGRRRAERYLLDARREVEQAIERLEARYGDAMSTSAGATARDPATIAKEARSTVELSLQELRRGTAEARPVAKDATEVGAGDFVRVASLGRGGRVLELRGGRAIIDAGGVRLTVPVEELEADEEPSPPRMRGHGTLRMPLLEARPEVDLRGLRADEVEALLVPAIDAAIQADLPSLRIIHGKGTGALREVVRELLAGDGRIPSFRLGSHEEGGSGVTLVELVKGT
ncbi:MAG: Smr/MutS family protein [Gemmatimonadota bacterium]